jgi:hypothetical protein
LRGKEEAIGIEMGLGGKIKREQQKEYENLI